MLKVTRRSRQLHYEQAWFAHGLLVIAVALGTIYFASEEGEVYLIKADGIKRWRNRWANLHATLQVPQRRSFF